MSRGGHPEMRAPQLYSSSSSAGRAGLSGRRRPCRRESHPRQPPRALSEGVAQVFGGRTARAGSAPQCPRRQRTCAVRGSPRAYGRSNSPTAVPVAARRYRRAQINEELAHVGFIDLGEITDAPTDQVVPVATQVATVGGGGVRGDAPLDHQVVEVAVHLVGQWGGAPVSPAHPVRPCAGRTPSDGRPRAPSPAVSIRHRRRRGPQRGPRDRGGVDDVTGQCHRDRGVQRHPGPAQIGLLVDALRTGQAAPARGRGTRAAPRR